MYLFALIYLTLPVLSAVQIYGNLTLKSFVVLSDFFLLKFYTYTEVIWWLSEMNEIMEEPLHFLVLYCEVMSGINISSLLV